MTDKTDSKERAEFEAHMRKLNACTRLERQSEAVGGNYRTISVQRAWELWQAARASLAASAGSEPVAADGWLHENGLLYRLTDERHPRNRDEINVTMADGSRSIESRSRRALELLDRIRATHFSPPEGMVGGWMPMADAPRDGTLILAAIYIHSSDGTSEWQRHAIYFDEERDCTYFDGGDDTGWEFDDYEFWMPLPPPPTTSAGSGKGE